MTRTVSIQPACIGKVRRIEIENARGAVVEAASYLEAAHLCEGATRTSLWLWITGANDKAHQPRRLVVWHGLRGEFTSIRWPDHAAQLQHALDVVAFDCN